MQRQLASSQKALSSLARARGRNLKVFKGLDMMGI